MKNSYLEKLAFTDKLLDNPVSNDLSLIIVIPAFNEREIIKTLNSLVQCDQPKGSVEVIVSINESELVSDDIRQVNEACKEQVNDFQKENKLPWISFYAIHSTNLPKKHAGVGLGRKIGMDEAVRRFESVCVDGPIVCFDADSLCSKNYLIEIEKVFEDKKILTACIAFEHPLEGDDYSDEIYDAIIDYELFLRYYNLCLKYIGFPYHYHTIGSSMVARSSVYQKEGGMNKRKAGEDFYFLQKLFPLGGVVELNTCRVYPSPRQSDRVPFGTGKAVNDILANQTEEYQTYPFEMFPHIRSFIDRANELYGLTKLQIGEWLTTIHPGIRPFLLDNGFVESILESNSQSPNLNRFMKRFFEYFSAFRILKLVHYLRDEHYNTIDINKAAKELLDAIAQDFDVSDDNRSLLIKYRKIEYGT